MQQADTYTRQLIQQRIDAIRENIKKRDGRDLSSAEIRELRRRLAQELAGFEVAP